MGYIDGIICFCVFIGKVVMVMWEKGCLNVFIIYSFIYKLCSMDEEVLNFFLWDEVFVGKVDLIVVDECLMVDEELGWDLLLFEKFVLVLGDFV